MKSIVRVEWNKSLLSSNSKHVGWRKNILKKNKTQIQVFVILSSPCKDFMLTWEIVG